LLSKKNGGGVGHAFPPPCPCMNEDDFKVTIFQSLWLWWLQDFDPFLTLKPIPYLGQYKLLGYEQ
jgi:hypothetical protein